ncbi:type I glyceraldehyde-3-phosphate dehydrogenase [Fibrobacterota bacterium]
MINAAINGFGRIGRAVTRLILNSTDIKLCFINEIDPDIDNLAYLLKYDSIYGRFNKKIKTDKLKSEILCKKQAIKVYSCPDPRKIPWNDHNIDVLIDATGVKKNVATAHKLINKGVKKVVITHSPPPQDIDATIVFGANEDSYDPQKHHVVSSSICDAIAIAPVLYELNNAWGIKSCFVTTLHPWLSYQNLLDGSLSSISNPGHFWTDFSLGRSSISNLIPKDTTAAGAVLKIIPELKNKIDAISFRVPTSIVSATDLTAVLESPATAEDINNHIKKMSRKKPEIFELQEEQLVSIDHCGTNISSIIDATRTKVVDKRMVKMVLWYDNEWGYSNKVLEMARLAMKK